MLVAFKKIEDLTNSLVDFYTVSVNGNALTEFELFDGKTFPNHEEESKILWAIISEIRTRGARKYYFKHEGPADALPKVSVEIMEANDTDYGIRLYCIRVNDNLLVLLNGDVKTKRDPTQCPNVCQHFRLAQAIGRSIDRMIQEKELRIVDYDCLTGVTLEL